MEIDSKNADKQHFRDFLSGFTGDEQLVYSLFLAYCVFSCYVFIMVIEQTVEVPASHRLTIDVPSEIPAGPVILAFRTAAVQKTAKAKQKHGTPITDRLSGCLAGIDDIDIEKIREERLAKYLK